LEAVERLDSRVDRKHAG